MTSYIFHRGMIQFYRHEHRGLQKGLDSLGGLKSPPGDNIKTTVIYKGQFVKLQNSSNKLYLKKCEKKKKYLCGILFFALFPSRVKCCNILERFKGKHIFKSDCIWVFHIYSSENMTNCKLLWTSIIHEDADSRML